MTMTEAPHENGRKQRATGGPMYVVVQRKLAERTYLTSAGIVTFDGDDGPRDKALTAAAAAGFEVRAIVDSTSVRAVR